MTGKKFKEQKTKRKNTSNGENWKGVMKYRTTGAKLGEKKNSASGTAEDKSTGKPGYIEV